MAGHRETNRSRHIPAFSHRSHTNQISCLRHADLRIRTRKLLNSRPIDATYSDYRRRSNPVQPVTPPEQLPTSKRCEHLLHADYHLPPAGQPILPAGDAPRDQTGDRAGVSELPAKHLFTMPTRQCDRLRWTIPAASYSTLRDSVPPATPTRNAVRGGLPRAALCLAGVDTADSGSPPHKWGISRTDC